MSASSTRFVVLFVMFYGGFMYGNWWIAQRRDAFRVDKGQSIKKLLVSVPIIIGVPVVFFWFALSAVQSFPDSQHVLDLRVAWDLFCTLAWVTIPYGAAQTWLLTTH